jgi:hypothetical protein
VSEVDSAVDYPHIDHGGVMSIATWEQFKREHPAGSEVTGTVTRVEPYGAFVDLGLPFDALLLVPYIAPIGEPKSYPQDYPKVGDIVTALIRIYAEPDAPGGQGKVGLTQDPGSVQVRDSR